MKNIIKYSLAIIFTLISAKYSIAQNKINELNIGDQCPNFEFDNIINHTSTLHLSDFKGKLVILDFWATWCSPCLRALGKMDSLQEKFKDKIAIIPVSNQEKPYVDKFFTRNKAYYFPRLTYVTTDTILQAYFPHRFIPHEVWINGTGKVVAITSDSDVTEKNIQEYLSGKLSSIKIKKDILRSEVDVSKPLLDGELVGYQINHQQITYQSLFLTRYIDGAGSWMQPKIIDGRKKRIFMNMIIPNLYGYALCENDSTTCKIDPNIFWQLPSRIILEVKDSSRFSYPGLSAKEWEKKPVDSICFTYEQYIPLADSLKETKYMIEDLNRYFGDMFGIEGLMEKRMVTCWSLSRISSGKELSKDTSGSGNGSITSLSNFMHYLMYLRQEEAIPILDETRYSNEDQVFLTTPIWEKIDIKDLKSLNNFLSRSGLQFELAKREMDMIVIRDKKALLNVKQN